MQGSISAAFCFIAILSAGIATYAQTEKPSLRTITIETQPNSSVWLDGVLYGRTSDSGELTITTVAPGRKSIRVRSDGFKESVTALLPTQRGKVQITLTKTTDPAELAFQEAERYATIDRAKAIKAYQTAIKLRPAYVDAHIGLARMFSEMGEAEKTEKAIAGLRKTKPGSPDASVIEGRLFKSIGEEDKAIASYKRALKEAAGFQPEAYAGLGIIYKERAEEAGSSNEYAKEAVNYTEAAKNLSMSIKQLSGAPDAVVMYQFLGLIYEQQKKPAQAIAVYEEFLRLFPNHPEAEAFQSFIVQLKKPH